MLELDGFISKLSQKGADIRPAVQAASKRYITLRIRKHEYPSPSARFLNNVIKDTVCPVDIFTIGSGSKDPAESVIYAWGNSNKSKRLKPLLPQAVFYWFFRYEAEPSYFNEIAKVAWAKHPEELERFLFAKNGGDKTDSFELVIERYHSSNLIGVAKPAHEVSAATLSGDLQTAEPALFKPNEIAHPDTWLSAHNFSAVPLFGRENELATLNQFLECDRLFSILPVIAPSGAGKTRLISEWMLKHVDGELWNYGFIRQEEAEQWRKFRPERPTVIAVDYLFGLHEILAQIIERKEQFSHPLRLILIDRNFPASIEDIPNDPLFSFLASDRNKLDQIRDTFFEASPLRLAVGEKNDVLLERILGHMLDKPPHDAALQAAIESLKRMGLAAQYPLYAILLGDSIKRTGRTTALNRRGLIEYYLGSQNRLPWKYPRDHGLTNILGQRGEHAAKLVCAASLLGKVKFSDYHEHLPSDVLESHCRIRLFIRHCNYIVSQNNEDSLSRFEPSIIGETFFLLFAIEHQFDRRAIEEFRKLIFSLSSDGVQLEPVRAFYSNMARNLILDEESAFSNEAWSAFSQFTLPLGSTSKPLAQMLRKMRSAALLGLMIADDDFVDNAIANNEIITEKALAKRKPFLEELRSRRWAAVNENFSYDDFVPCEDDDDFWKLALGIMRHVLDQEMLSQSGNFADLKSRGRPIYDKLQRRKGIIAYTVIGLGFMPFLLLMPLLFFVPNRRKNIGRALKFMIASGEKISQTFNSVWPFRK